MDKLQGGSVKFIDEIDIKEKKVLFRFDFNVPLDNNLKITDDTRIRAVLPTLNHALDENARIIVMSHLGRPKGKPVPKFSLAPVAKRLSRLLDKQVGMAADCVGPDVKRLIEAMKPGEVVLLENLRFHPEEEKNDDGFAKELASFADIFIDDAFGNAHRRAWANDFRDMAMET
jgi:phosphoglycerate kinase